jgi:RecJ-like exonuclease
MSKYGLGISICLRDKESAKFIEEVSKEYRSTLAKYMDLIVENKNLIQELNNIIVVRGEKNINENMSGAISSMISVSSNFDKNKALLVVTKTKGDMVKISARVKDELLKNQSIDLGKILAEASNKNGGIGGGHRMAAGAKVTSAKLENFLKDVDKEMANLKNE